MATRHRSSAVRYVVVWAALLAMTGLSFLASLVHLGAAEPIVALAIAGAKSALVLLFFMHLAEERLVNALVPIFCLAYVLLLLSLLSLDILTRHTFPAAPNIGLPVR